MTEPKPIKPGRPVPESGIWENTETRERVHLRKGTTTRPTEEGTTGQRWKLVKKLND